MKSNLNLTTCYSMRLRDIPLTLQKAQKSNDFYISAKVKDRLILFFQESCGQNIICILQSGLRKNTTKTLTFHKSYFDYYLENDSHGFIRCTNSRGEEFLSFHVLVKKDDGKFFTDMSIDNLKNRLFIKCPGGFYSKDVKLKVNGQYTDADYDPLRGFNISTNKSDHRLFYQCEKFGENSEIKGLISNMNSTGLNARNTTFSMKKEVFMYQTELQCIMESPNKDELEDFKVILSCPKSTICPIMSRKPSKNRNQVVLFGMVNNDLLSSNLLSEFSCVFLNDGFVVGNVFLEEPEDQTILIVGISLIVIIVLFSLLIHSCGNLETKPSKGFIDFKESQLLLDNAEQIGKGHSATVHMVEIKDSCLKIVVKYSRKSTHFLRELKMLQSAKHPNIVALLGTTEIPVKRACYKTKIQHLVLPYYPEKSLHEFINKFTPYKFRIEADQPIFSSHSDDQEEISLFDMISISMQVGMALEYLKEKQITHRDIALRNVLISHERICKLADFERAKHGETRKISIALECQKKLQKSQTLRKFIKSKKMPTNIYPIEALDGYYFYASEVYSFGNLLLTLFKFGESQPFHSWEHYTLNLQKVPDPPEKCPTEIYKLIVKCMQFDHKSRPDIGRCVDAIKYFARGLSERKFVDLVDELDAEGDRDFIEEYRQGSFNTSSGYLRGPHKIQFESLLQDSAV